MRMGGVDKGLQLFKGQALTANAIQRLVPQVGALAVNANRHEEAYAAFGTPIWPDANLDYSGPLAGFLTGLERAETDWLLTVPCDAPLFPLDLVARLSAALNGSTAPLAIASTHDGAAHRVQPVFCLMRCSLARVLRAHLRSEQSRQVEAWVRSLGGIEVSFPDANAFANVNTLAELSNLQGHG